MNLNYFIYMRVFPFECLLETVSGIYFLATILILNISNISIFLYKNYEHFSYSGKYLMTMVTRDYSLDVRHGSN